MHILVQGTMKCKLEYFGVDAYEIVIKNYGTVLYEKTFNHSNPEFMLKELYDIQSDNVDISLSYIKDGSKTNLTSQNVSVLNDTTDYYGMIKNVFHIFFISVEEYLIVDFNLIMVEDTLIKKSSEITPILNGASSFKVSAPSRIQQNPLDDCFFFADNKNLLFAEYTGKERTINIYDEHESGIHIEDILPEIERHFEREIELIPKPIVDPLGPRIKDEPWDHVRDEVLNNKNLVLENDIYESMLKEENTVISLAGNSYVKDGGIALAVNEMGVDVQNHMNNVTHLTSHSPLMLNNMLRTTKKLEYNVSNNKIEELESQHKPVFGSIKDVTVYKYIEWKYAFSSFYHGNIDGFIKTLSYKGLDGLLKRSSQVVQDTMDFEEKYKPNTDVVFTEEGDIPSNAIDFNYKGAYSGYNWELFFHIPMTIASKLSRDQQFDEAQKWYHYIFNPTTSETGGRERFWQFKPFYDESCRGIKSLSDCIDNEELIKKWEQDPFNPHLIARLRITAYMKNTVMKYLDNIIAWADMLFRRDSLESINEAVNLYIIAAKILGARPEVVPSRVKPVAQTYSTLEESGFDNLTNAIVEIESFIPPSSKSGGNNNNIKLKSLGTMFYFGIPKNKKLIEYWDTIEDRLFKIRHSMNIDGVERTLPLFQPPIDPGLLVKAAAAGVDISSVLMDIGGASTPPYRFSYVIDKAKQFAEEVRYLGGALLSAIEKKDAEGLAMLRHSHEEKMLDIIEEVREKQCDEALQRKEALKQSKKSAEERLSYFSSRTLTNEYEQEYLDSLESAIEDIKKQTTTETVAAALAAIPDFKIGSPTTVGTTLGGSNLAKAAMAFASAYSSGVSESNIKGTKANAMGGFQRRVDDWEMQKTSTDYEIKQMEREILAADLRIAIANKELESHRNQIENVREKGEFMQNKFSSTALYEWYIDEISSIYFRAYQLAYDMAKKAQKCYEFETGDTTSYIGFGYWNSLKKGLLSSETLIFDLNRLETAYLDNNKRDKYELEKHVSLLTVDPQALLKLQTEGVAEFNLPEYIFDLDYPGHYNRRIKSISITLPCVTGPYHTINCTLRMLKHFTRKQIDTSVSEYYEQGIIEAENVVRSIATSSGQNDCGMFELNFRDERYLPFEGCGAVSQWRIELMPEKKLRQFDYHSINDVIIHVKYTAKEDAVKREDIIDKLKNYVSNTPLSRIFSSRIEYSSEWYQFFNPADEETSTMDYPIRQSSFSYMCRNSRIKVKKLKFYGQFNEADGQDVTLNIQVNGTTQSVTFTLSKLPDKEFHEYTLETQDSVSSSNQLQTFYIDELDSEIQLVTDKKYNRGEVKDIIMAIEYVLE